MTHTTFEKAPLRRRLRPSAPSAANGAASRLHATARTGLCAARLRAAAASRVLPANGPVRAHLDADGTDACCCHASNAGAGSAHRNRCRCRGGSAGALNEREAVVVGVSPRSTSAWASGAVCALCPGVRFSSLSPFVGVTWHLEVSDVYI